jgi:hypothetical protein
MTIASAESHLDYQTARKGRKKMDAQSRFSPEKSPGTMLSVCSDRTAMFWKGGQRVQASVNL